MRENITRGDKLLAALITVIVVLFVVVAGVVLYLLFVSLAG